MPFAMRALIVASLVVFVSAGSSPRNVIIDGSQFKVSKTNKSIALKGPSIVVTGAPWLPSVDGSTPCDDTVSNQCKAAGTCKTCVTFDASDVAKIKKAGSNTIRLGVVWAGAQPKDEDALDPEFVARLHKILDLTDKEGIHVVLNNHVEDVGAAGCGNGAPMWFQKKAAADLIGKPLFSPPGHLDVSKLIGYDKCGPDASKWAAHAGDPNYNLLNACCQALNSADNHGGLAWSSVSTQTMEYMLAADGGRAYFVRFWELMAKAVVNHPSAVAAELWSKPQGVVGKRSLMFDTWRDCARKINELIPDMSVSLIDTEAPFSPEMGLSADMIEWIRGSHTVFYAWHGGIARDTRMPWQMVSKPSNAPSFVVGPICGGQLDNTTSQSDERYSIRCDAKNSYFGPNGTFGACIFELEGGTSPNCGKRRLV